MTPEGLDDECRTGFVDLIVKARTTTELDGWASEPEGALALVVLLDQLSRNVFRGTADAFSGDAKAASIAVQAIARGLDRKVPLARAVVFYMPLMHSESLLAQVAAKSCIEAFEARCAVAGDEAMRPFAAKMLQGAQVHLEVIDRFGRYPSRNVALGRESTEAEVEFLKERPSGFPPMGGPL